MIKTLTIMGRTINIRHVTMAEIRELNPDHEPDKELHAWYSPAEYIIYIYKGLDGESYKRILLHEIMHSFISISGLSNLLSDELEEAVCDLTENMLELFQNKEFIKELS